MRSISTCGSPTSSRRPERMTADVPSYLFEAEALLREADAAPAFAEPWMAHVFACAVQLSRQGLFPWSEWVEVFSTEIVARPAQPGETSNAAYYRQWLAALETIVGLKGAASTAEITERQQTWRQAYLNTPHGQPVELRHAAMAPTAAAHDHHHHHQGAPKPVTISAPLR
jgi:nitrile hydratase accessory protein